MEKERAGRFISILSGELEYKAYEPSNLPPMPKIEFDEELSTLIGMANRTIGILDGMSARIPDIDLFVAMYVRKEALLSSQIEGTQATLDDILDPNIEENTNLEVSDVINYIKAMQLATNRLQELPICNTLFREIHEVLMKGVRGEDKNPGEFRRSQNWIGPQGCSLKDAVYVPTSPEIMDAAMSNLEKYINSEDEMDALIKIGLAHYQFETVHPFLDGNGRISRMLITLWLMEQKILKYPVFYISYYLKRNRVEYYDRLTEVRRKGNYEQWIKFFLKGIIASSEDAVKSIEEIIRLNDLDIQKVKSISGRNKNIIKLFEYLGKNPIIDIAKTAKELNLQYNTVAKAVEKLGEIGILKQVNKAKRNRCFAYDEYLKILKKDTQNI